MEERRCPLCNAPSLWDVPEVSISGDARRVVCPRCMVFEIHREVLDSLVSDRLPDGKRRNLVRRSRYFHDAGLTLIITARTLDAIPS